MIHFSLPGMWGFHNNLIPLLALYNNQPELFKDNIIIDAVYGNFYFCPWDGGRAEACEENFDFTTEEDIYNIKHIYNDIFHIPIRFVLTNSIITSKDYKDKFCNNFLKICEEDYNLITIANNNLENYIREKYPKYKYISSLTKFLSKEEIIQELESNKYERVCFPFQYNKDIIFLDSIPYHLRDKSELLINTQCSINCIMIKEHHKLESYANLNYCIPKNNFICPYRNISKQEQGTIPINNINSYLQMGYNHYKINGRIVVSRKINLKFLLTYLLKKEYYDQIFKFIYNLPKIDLKNFNKQEIFYDSI